MNLAAFAIKRPILVTCTVLLLLVIGFTAMMRLPVDNMPDVSFPVALVTTVYPGAGPKEVEMLVTKPVEDSLSTLAGLKRLTSINKEGVSFVVAEFNLETSDKEAEQLVRDRVRSIQGQLPKEIEDPTVMRWSMSDMPLVQFSVVADLPAGALYDLANEEIKPRLQQVENVGQVELIGGRKREIRVELDRDKLQRAGISVGQVAGALQGAGSDIPVGKVSGEKSELLFRTLGQFQSVSDVARTLVCYAGNEVPVRVADLGRVVDGLEDEKNRGMVDGHAALFLFAYRRTGTNRMEAAEALKKEIVRLNGDLKGRAGSPRVELLWDSSKYIKYSLNDVRESILLGIALTIVVVLFFLGSMRSTVITSLALPNSLLGAFILMAVAGFTINYMTLLALSLAVGLLVDDAIVVRENIWRHLEMGKHPGHAAVEGTREVALAVVATTMVLMAVFGPIAFLKGMIGQFFKQFGLTIVFAMAISLYDSMTIAPMLSAYFAEGKEKAAQSRLYRATLGAALEAFGRLQDRVDALYAKVVRWSVGNRWKVLGGSALVFAASLAVVGLIPKGFMPPDDYGDYTVQIELAPGASLDAMQKAALEVERVVRANPEVKTVALNVGNRDGEAYVASLNVQMVDEGLRKVNTQQMMERMRTQLKPYAQYRPLVVPFDPMGGGQREFALVLECDDLDALESYSLKLYDRLKKHPGLKDVDISFRAGKPEFQVVPDADSLREAGVSPLGLGMELRAQTEGLTPAKYRENGREYDVRVRLADGQRDLEREFNRAWVPNMNGSLVRLRDIAGSKRAAGPSTINRQNRSRSVTIQADMAGQSIGLQQAMDDTRKIIKDELPLPRGAKYEFPGMGEMYEEMVINMAIALVLALIFIYLVLSSLYEHFVTPFNIMLVLPLAMSGAFFALLISGKQLDMFSMIGCIMLLGLAAKNSILLVDYANQKVAEGMTREDAIIRAGEVRLRPILMTSAALIAGMLPVAFGQTGASRQRASMGIAVIGGLVTSTLLSLVVVPASYALVDRLRARVSSWFRKPEDLDEVTHGNK